MQGHAKGAAGGGRCRSEIASALQSLRPAAVAADRGPVVSKYFRPSLHVRPHRLCVCEEVLQGRVCGNGRSRSRSRSLRS